MKLPKTLVGTLNPGLGLGLGLGLWGLDYKSGPDVTVWSTVDSCSSIASWRRHRCTVSSVKAVIHDNCATRLHRSRRWRADSRVSKSNNHFGGRLQLTQRLGTCLANCWSSVITRPTCGANILDRIYVYDLSYVMVRVVTSTIRSNHKAIIT